MRQSASSMRSSRTGQPHPSESRPPQGSASDRTHASTSKAVRELCPRGLARVLNLATRSVEQLDETARAGEFHLRRRAGVSKPVSLPGWRGIFLDEIRQGQREVSPRLQVNRCIFANELGSPATAFAAMCRSASESGSVCAGHQVRSGAGALGSIPKAVASAGSFAVLVLIRFVSLMFILKGSSETGKNESEEGSMSNRKVRVLCSCIVETAWALGGSVAAGLLLLP